MQQVYFFTKKKKSFSLIEIMVSLALFSFILTIVVSTAITLVSAQKRVQADIFLTQSAQSTLENITRNIRFGYNYSGSTFANYQNTPGGETLFVNAEDVSNSTGSVSSSSQLLTNAANSPFIIYESQSGNPTILSDQNAYCFAKDSNGNGKLYKVTSFQIQTNNITYFRKCSEGEPLLPEKVNLDYLVFDVYGQSSTAPKNPMVRLKLKLTHVEGGSVEMQTTVTQRLIPYF
jgi:type II secretory pathway pseudopilin PulG